MRWNIHAWAVLLAAAACSPETEGEADRGDGPQATGRTPAHSSASARADAGTTAEGASVRCERHEVGGERATPDLLIVLDRSTSMTPEGNDRQTDRWTGSVDAVVKLTASYDDRLNFGLMTFPAITTGQPVVIAGGGRASRGDRRSQPMANMAAQCTPGTVNVELGPMRGDDIARVLRATEPNGYTPTAATLAAALPVIGETLVVDQGFVPPKYVLLLTDGDPNCSADFNAGAGGRGGGTDARARAETIEAIEMLTEAGVQTYVVGYQTAGSDFERQLDTMAAAGGTGEQRHRSVESARDLETVFDEIAGRAVSCSYKLDNEVKDPSFVQVTVRGQPRRYQNPGDGWVLGPDRKTVTLTGAACEAAQLGAPFSVEVTCEPIQFI